MHPPPQVRFVTNTTKDTTSNLVRLLQAMDFDIQQHEVRLQLASQAAARASTRAAAQLTNVPWC